MPYSVGNGAPVLALGWREGQKKEKGMGRWACFPTQPRCRQQSRTASGCLGKEFWGGPGGIFCKTLGEWLRWARGWGKAQL